MAPKDIIGWAITILIATACITGSIWMAVQIFKFIWDKCCEVINEIERKKKYGY